MKDGVRFNAFACFWDLANSSELGRIESPHEASVKLSDDGEVAFLYLEGGKGIPYVRGLYFPRRDFLKRIRAEAVGGFPVGNYFKDMRGCSILRGNEGILYGDRLYRISADSLNLVHLFRSPEGPGDFPGTDYELVADPLGKTGVICISTNTIGIFDLETGKIKVGPIDFNHPVSRIAFSPDGHLLAIATVEGRVELLDSQTGKPLAPAFFANLSEGIDAGDFRVRTSFIRELEFSANGDHLLISTMMGGVFLWDMPQVDDIEKNLQTATLIGDRKTGGNDHGRLLSSADWYEKWKQAPAAIRSELLKDGGEPSKSGGRYEPWETLFEDEKNETELFRFEAGRLVSTARKGWLVWNGVGPGMNPEYIDFEFRAMVRTGPNANSDVRFHVADRGEISSTGIEVKINGTNRRLSTGSLPGSGTVRDNVRIHSDDKWFELRVHVEGEVVSVYVDGTLVTIWTQPDDWESGDSTTCQLGAGTFALQSNQGTVEFKDIRVRRLVRKSSQ